MYLEGADFREPLAASTGIRLALAATAVLTLAIGIFPEPVVRHALALAGISQ
jgi:hypothetical protein